MSNSVHVHRLVYPDLAATVRSDIEDLFDSREVRKKTEFKGRWKGREQEQRHAGVQINAFVFRGISLAVAGPQVHRLLGLTLGLQNLFNLTSFK